MLMNESAQFIQDFITEIDAALTKLKPNAKLTKTQKIWLAVCLTGMLLVNAVCWAKFERASLGKHKQGALSWMLRHSKIFWNYLLIASVILILERYEITEGVLVLDESDVARSKQTKRIYKAPLCQHTCRL